MRSTRIILSLVLVAACQSVETPQQADARIAAESEAARTEIATERASFERWYANGDVDSAALALTVNHHSHAPNQPLRTGRAEWLSWARPMAAMGKVSIRHQSESVVASGPIAVEHGRFVMDFTPGPAAPAGTKASADTGKYLWHWSKVDGHWLLAVASWNSNLAPPK